MYNKRMWFEIFKNSHQEDSTGSSLGVLWAGQTSTAWEQTYGQTSPKKNLPKLFFHDSEDTTRTIKKANDKIKTPNPYFHPLIKVTCSSILSLPLSLSLHVYQRLHSTVVRNLLEWHDTSHSLINLVLYHEICGLCQKIEKSCKNL